MIMFLNNRINELQRQVRELEKENLKLKSEVYVYKDAQLRTYDGLAGKADVLKQVVKFLTTLVSECDDLNITMIDVKDIRELLNELQRYDKSSKT